MPALGSNLSFYFHKNSSLNSWGSSQNRGWSIWREGWHVPHSKLSWEEPPWIHSPSVLRNAVKLPYLSELFPQKAAGELQYWFPSALPDRSTNSLQAEPVSRAEVCEERSSRLLFLILYEKHRYSRNKWQCKSQNGKIIQKKSAIWSNAWQLFVCNAP